MPKEYLILGTMKWAMKLWSLESSSWQRQPGVPLAMRKPGNLLRLYYTMLLHSQSLHVTSKAETHRERILRAYFAPKFSQCNETYTRYHIRYTEQRLKVLQRNSRHSKIKHSFQMVFSTT